MPNGARHAIGVVAGLVLTPALAAAILFGTGRLIRGFQTFQLDAGDYRLGCAVLAVAGLLLGVLVGSRISPLASLIPGLVFSAVGVLWVAAPRWAVIHTAGKLPETLDRGYNWVGPFGGLLLGLLLLVASLFPSRWAARSPRPAAGPAYEHGGGPVPPYGQGAPGAPGAPAPLPQRQPGHSALSGQQGSLSGQRPGPGQPPAPYQPGPSSPPAAYSPPPPAPERRPAAGQQDEGEAGSWTQIYGTGRPDKDDRGPEPR